MPIQLKDIRVGWKAEIETFSPAGTHENRLFSTLVDSTETEEGLIRVLAPLEMLAGHRIRSDEHFKLFFLSSGMLLQAHCVAVGYERSNQTILLVAKLAARTQIENANRRNNYRVKTVIATDLWPVSDTPVDDPPVERVSGTEEKPTHTINTPEIPPMKCLSSDLSAGGIGLLLPEKLELNERVVCRLKLDKGDIQGYILFEGVTVRTVNREKTDAYPYAAGIRIIKISPTDESLMLRFSLACQREELRMRSDQR